MSSNQSVEERLRKMKADLWRLKQQAEENRQKEIEEYIVSRRTWCDGWVLGD